MSEPKRDTIFALSSGRGPAAIAVIRISGPRAGEAIKALGVRIPEPRKAGLARVRDPKSGDTIDEALVLWFPAPHSETGEDVAELQLHGGRAVIAATLGALCRVEGLRPAEPGEFTRQAFENGKLDLTAVEGLADLVMAETEGQRRQAFRQMMGLLGERAEAWRQRLIQALALVEARIDFSDETDVPENLVEPALRLVRELEGDIAAVLRDGAGGERLREGLVVAIAGPPNAGKSTVLNRIARREAAIVSPYAGTTRDVIEVHLDLGGLPVTLLDTAGIRDTDDPVEMEGVRRARERAAGADLVLWVVDASAAGGPADLARRDQGSSCGFPAVGCVPIWLILNKIDLIPVAGKNESFIQNIDSNEPIYSFNKHLKLLPKNKLCTKNEYELIKAEHILSLSASTGEGFELLQVQLLEYAKNFMAGAESALVTRERHRRVLEDTLAALQRALGSELAGREDLLAEELRTAAHALGRLTGRVDVEDILDVIFRDFCIGK